MSQPTPEEIKQLEERRLKLHRDIKSREQRLTSLDNSITEKTTQQSNLQEGINQLNTQKSAIEVFINENRPVKEQLETQISTLKTQNGEQTNIKNQLVQDQNNLKKNIQELNTEKTSIEENVQNWKTKSKLYTNDIAGIGEDNTNQRYTHAIAAIASFIGAIILMYFLISNFRSDIHIPEVIQEVFKGDENYIFYLTVLTRISLAAAMFILIFVFINLTRGFVSQYIRVQNKMTALRMLMFLVDKIGNESANISEDQMLAYENEKIKRQNEVFNEHVPSLIEYNPSSFDKLSKTASPMEMLNRRKNKDKEEG